MRIAPNDAPAASTSATASLTASTSVCVKRLSGRSSFTSTRAPVSGSVRAASTARPGTVPAPWKSGIGIRRPTSYHAPHEPPDPASQRPGSARWRPRWRAPVRWHERSASLPDGAAPEASPLCGPPGAPATVTGDPPWHAGSPSAQSCRNPAKQCYRPVGEATPIWLGRIGRAVALPHGSSPSGRSSARSTRLMTPVPFLLIPRGRRASHPGIASDAA